MIRKFSLQKILLIFSNFFRSFLNDLIKKNLIQKSSQNHKNPHVRKFSQESIENLINKPKNLKQPPLQTHKKRNQLKNRYLPKNSHTIPQHPSHIPENFPS